MRFFSSVYNMILDCIAFVFVLMGLFIIKAVDGVYALWSKVESGDNEDERWS